MWPLLDGRIFATNGSLVFVPRWGYAESTERLKTGAKSSEGATVSWARRFFLPHQSYQCFKADTGPCWPDQVIDSEIARVTNALAR